MKKTLKKKLCWNCEGNVTFQQENCPYCGVYLSPSDGEEDENTLLPPYHISVAEEEASTSTNYAFSEESEQNKDENLTSEAFKEIPSYEIKAVVLPLSLLLIGVSFGLFSLVLLLFSHNGYLTLSWDADLWYFYLLIAIPAFAFGYRYLIQNYVDSES